MKEEFERLSTIKHYKNVKFNLDRVLKAAPRRAINDRSLINKIRDSAVEFKRDEASHSWSTFRIDGVVDSTMHDESAAVIISQLDSKTYFFRVNFIVRVESTGWII